MPPVRRPPPAFATTYRCRFEDDTGLRCRRVATVGNKLCRQHALVLQLELDGDASRFIGDIDRAVSEHVRHSPVASAIANAVSGLFGNLFVREQARARARQQPPQRPPRSHARERDPGSRPPPHSPPPPRPTPPPDPVPRAREILGFEPAELLTADRVKARHKALARVFHPDMQGGSIEAMKRVNLAADVLLAKLAKRS